MATLQIKKKSDKTWEHIDSELGTFIVSKFYFNADFGKFQIVEQGQSKRRIYDVTDIEVFDIGGSAETFVNITQLSLRLEELSYVGFSYEQLIINGGLDETADHYLGTWNASTNTPTLTNGVGQVGNHYKVSVAGTQFSTSFGVGDIISQDEALNWYKSSNNNQTPKRKHSQITRFNNGAAANTEDTWYGFRNTTNSFDTNTFFTIPLTGSPLNAADWRGEIVPFPNSKVISAALSFFINTANITNGVEVYLLRKDNTEGGSSESNLEIISQTIDSRSLLSGAYYRTVLTINSHTSFTNTTKLYFAVRKRTGGGASGSIIKVDLLIDYLEQ